MASKTKHYEVTELMQMFNEYRAYKRGILKEWRLIRSLYKGEFWQVFRKYLQEYTITPDWNYFDYTVQAYLNSIYSGAFIGTVTPKNEDDQEFVQELNAFITYNWNKWGMKNKFLHIGENGELYNLGAVRVDWDAKKRCVNLQTLTPDEVYFDPNVSNYRDGEAVFIERAINIHTLKKNPNFKQAVEKYLATHKNNIQDKTQANRIAGYENTPTTKKSTVSFIEAFIRNENGNIDQVFILDEEEIVYENLDLAVKCFPIAVYTPQRPDGNPYGNSKLNKILNSVIALNMLDSLEATQPYRLLNRPRFVNVDGRINMRAFVEHGNTPNASFEVKGDPRNIVFYQDIPTVPDLTNLKNRIENSIFQITGVDPYYKGRMTNSIQTTGGTQAFQARVTMLTDNARITLLEEFCEDITRLIITYYMEYGSDNVYKVPKLSATGTNKVISTYKVSFNDKSDVSFDYMISASTLLPMNQANLFESAKALYEMQGQYGFKTPVITEQDLIRYSDFPQKDLILQRIERDNQDNTAQNLVADLTNFASIFTRLLSQGLTEEQAAQQAITILIEEKNAMQQDPSIGQGFQ